MNSPIISSAIQQKFYKLLQEINFFFAGERQLIDKDRAQLTLARISAFDLAQETSSPQFDRFLAYLLGSTEINSDYPLQAVRMVCLTAKALQGEKISMEQRQEILTAALVADTGFRPAWLGHHGTHFEITAYQLKGLSLPWFTPGLERLILAHHAPDEDPSLSRILSLVARYLGMVYGTGIEDIGQPLVSPSKTMETLMTEFHPEASGMRLLLKAISAFPLGSWVHLNSGQVGLVMGASARNPLRPKVSLYQDASKTASRWEELDLEKKPTLHISGELSPTDAQLSLLNFPELLIPGWVLSTERAQSLRQPPAASLINSVDTGAPGSTLPGSLKTTEDYRQFVMQKNRPSAPMEPMEHSRSMNPAGWKPESSSGNSPGDKQNLLKFYREELVKLRATWEQQVRAAEQVSASLKSPLIESYRRENELMSVMIERLEAIGADVSTPAEETEIKALPSPETIETVETPVNVKSPFELSDNPQTGLTQIQNHLNSFQDQVIRDEDSLRQLKEEFARTLRHLDSREFKTLPSLIAFVRQWQQKLQPMGHQLDALQEKMTALTDEWNTLHTTVSALTKESKKTFALAWKEQLRRRMETVLTTARRALDAQHHRLKTHEEMIERFCSEARQLTND